MRIVFTLFFLSVTAVTMAQKEAFVWYFGRKAGLDFNTTPPTMLSNSPNPGNLDTDEAHATICDKNGNLLFYTNGQTIWSWNTATSTFATMPNGTGLNGHWSTTQCATVFPVPGSATDYYILTTPLTGTNKELQWNRIDMSLNAGEGDIKTPVASNKNQAMPSCPTFMMESVVSVPHFNGTDIWVIAHTADDPSTNPANEGGSFIVWLVTSAGISYSNTYTLGYAYPYDNVGGVSRGIGIMKSNSCFNRLFISYYNASSRVEGFSFDNSTGAVGNWPAPVSGPLVIDQYRNSGGTMTAIGSFSYGLEVSPNGRYLYNTISGETGNRELTQYDLNAGNTAAIVASAVRLTPAAADGVRYGQLQLGPDGKIYHTIFNWNNIGSGGYCHIATIGSPNTAGAGASYTESPYVWPASATGVGSSMGLTSFHKGFLSGKAAITSTVDDLANICLGNTAHLTATSTGSIVSYSWNIDQNLNATVDYTGSATVNHTYGATGTYTVELKVTDACGYNYTSYQDVTVLPQINSAGTVNCGPPITGNVTAPNGAYTYVWYSDAAATNAIATGTSATLPVSGTSGTVYLKATSGSSSSAVGLTNGPAGGHPWGGSDAGTSHTMSFTVNKAPLTFTSFEWEAPYGAWAASNQNTTFQVQLINSSGTVLFTNNRTVATNGPSWVNGYPFTETVNLALPLGTYNIVITATSGVGGPIKYPSSCTTSQADAQGALTYASAGTCGIASTFIYSLTQYTVTPLACSNAATVNWNCPLPVTWLSFTGKHQDNGNALTWMTASEDGASYFDVERSTDGATFEPIGRVKAAGFSNSIRTYTYLDEIGASGVVYYRLRQVDLDGKASYSSTIAVNSVSSAAYGLLPNPGDGIVYLTGGSEAAVTVNIIDVQGRVVISNVSAHTGTALDLTGLSKGVYLIQIIESGSVQTLRYVLQ